jgi:hypothetical protein
VACVEAKEAGETASVIMEFSTLHDTEEDLTRRWHHPSSPHWA